MRFDQTLSASLEPLDGKHLNGYVQVETQTGDDDEDTRPAYYVKLFAEAIIGGEAELREEAAGGEAERGGVCIDITDLRVVESLARTMLQVVERARALGFPDKPQRVTAALT